MSAQTGSEVVLAHCKQAQAIARPMPREAPVMSTVLYMMKDLSSIL